MDTTISLCSSGISCTHDIGLPNSQNIWSFNPGITVMFPLGMLWGHLMTYNGAKICVCRVKGSQTIQKW